MSKAQPQYGGSAPGGHQFQPDELNRTKIHDVLSNERRQQVLELLQEDEPRDLSALAEAIATAETGEDPAPRNKRSSAYVSLHQTHLPKLDKLGIVDYDDRSKVVRLDVNAPEVLVECDGGEVAENLDEPDAWSGGLMAFASAGLALVGASAVGLPIVSTISSGAYATGTLVVLLTVLAYRMGRDRSTAPDGRGDFQK